MGLTIGVGGGVRAASGVKPSGTIDITLTGITAIVALWRVAAPWAAAVAVIVGVLKEVYDHYNGGCVEVGDVLATAGGGLLMQVAILGYLFLW